MIQSRNHFRVVFFVLTFYVTVFRPGQALAIQNERKSPTNSILERISRKLDENPNHSDSWRMLGKILARQENFENAVKAYKHAIESDSENAAAHYDLGTLLAEQGHTAESRFHLQRLYEIAPQGEYTRRILAKGFEPEPPKQMPGNEADNSDRDVFLDAAYLAKVSGDGGGDIALTGYEIQTFDGADDLSRGLDRLDSIGDPNSEKRWRLMGETGVLYNTNVALAPISRQLAASSEASAQWIANTEVEYTAWKNDRWRAGPIGRGNFTTNESQVSHLNLASFQVGSFFERDVLIADRDWISRLEYQFAIDQFGGENIGDRHSITGSLMKVDPAAISYIYAILGATEFRDDGVTPDITSLDGNSYTIGISRFFLTSNPLMPTWNIGLDSEFADTEGRDYQYYSLRVHGQSTLQIVDKWSLITSAGLGFRAFPEFTGAVNRDELTGRLGIKLQHQLNARCKISFLADYDRFASDNETYDLDRFSTGIVTTFRY